MTDTVLVAIITATPPTIAATLAYFTSLQNKKKLKEVAVQINGKMDELIASTDAAGRAEGINEGIKQNKAEVIQAAKELEKTRRK